MILPVVVPRFHRHPKVVLAFPPVFPFILMNFRCLLCYQLLCLLVSCLVNKHVRVTAVLLKFFSGNYYCFLCKRLFCFCTLVTYVHLSSFKTYTGPALLWPNYRCPVRNSSSLKTHGSMLPFVSMLLLSVHFVHFGHVSHLRCSNLTKYCCSTCISPAFRHTQALCCLNLSGY